jgi:hypothetical protein
VTAARWKANNENSGRFVAALLLLIASVAAFILGGNFFSFEPSVILYNPEGIIHKILLDIRLIRPPNNRRQQVPEKMVE